MQKRVLAALNSMEYIKFTRLNNMSISCIYSDKNSILIQTKELRRLNLIELVPQEFGRKELRRLNMNKIE